MIEDEPDKHLTVADVVNKIDEITKAVVSYYAVVERNKMVEIDDSQLRSLLENCRILSDFVSHISTRASAMLAQQSQLKH